MNGFDELIFNFWGYEFSIFFVLVKYAYHLKTVYGEKALL